jgi:hypothetical protein
MPRQQLPPQIKKITLKNGEVRYHVKENGRVDSITKQRPKPTSDSTPRRKRVTPCATSSPRPLGAPT